MELCQSTQSEETPKSFLSPPEVSIPARRWLAWSVGEKIFVFAISALFLMISIGAVRRESLTDNELLFIPAGLSYLQRHDARMDIEEPPFVKIIAAVPALLLHARADYTDSSWTTRPGSYDPEYLFGQKFFETWNPNQKAILFAVRLPMIGLTLLLGLSLYTMARQLAGRWAAMVTLGLFATSPFYFAYGSMVHMDVPIALFSVWTMWSFASLWQKPTMRNGLLFAASLAGALLTKFSGVFLFPSILIAWAWFRYQTRNSGAPAPAGASGRSTFERERLAIGAIVLAFAVVYVLYTAAFYRTDVPSMLLNESDAMSSIRYHVLPVDILARRLINHPALQPFLRAPFLYAGGLAYVLGHGSRPMYFLGRMYPHGVWFYFPAMSFLKLAPGMIFVIFLLVALTIAKIVRRKTIASSVVPDSDRFHVAAVLVGLVVFAAIAMASSLNIGIRHFSVPITFIVLLCSLIIPMTRSVLGPRARPFAFATIAALVLSCLVTALLAYPHYMSYYNVFRLNMPKQEIAQNSNLDWGQSMEELAEFFREHGVSAPYVDKDTGTISPSIYIPGAHLWSCDSPDPVAPEWVAMSSYKLTQQTPRCLQFERYPSWNIGDGAVTVFHIPDSTLSGALKTQ